MRLSRLIARDIAAETRICANHGTVHHNASSNIPLAAVALNIAAGCLTFAHTIFGTAVFSALQFISLTDVMNNILWRLIMSTAVCRVILIVELAGLRALKQEALS